MKAVVRWLAPLVVLLVAASCDEDDPTAPDGVIDLTQAMVAFTGELVGADPDPQTVEITNSGTGTLRDLEITTKYDPGQPTGWLTATLSSTTAPATLTLTPVRGSLGEGTYTARLHITTSAALNSPRGVYVSFEVGDSRALFDFTAPAGAPAVTSVSLRGEMNGWGETAMTQDGDTWSLRVDLAPGTYQYKFFINGNWPGDMCNDATWGDPTSNFWIDPDADSCVSGGNAQITID